MKDFRPLPTPNEETANAHACVPDRWLRRRIERSAGQARQRMADTCRLHAPRATA